MKKIVVSAAIAALLILSTATGASADETVPSSAGSQASLCSGSRVYYTVKSSGYTFQQASGANSAVTGGPGVTLTIGTSTTFEVSGSVTTTGGITVQAGIAAIKAEVGVTVGARKAGTTSSSGAWKVPSSYKIGKLQIGALKYQGTIKKYLENKSCVGVLQATTLYNAPQQAWHFQTSKVA